ncbi:MAG: non-heme iron oxygenase ferredoxin subunit [Actinomycetia bacterium]|nr:non-heme iron oxygenase ferredoxin subunit [Actinomycetes bacterium]
MPEIEVCPLEELPPGSVRAVASGEVRIGIFNAGGELHAIEDRCSHDDGSLAEGDFEADECVVVCPRHGAEFDVRTGEALTLPAYLPVSTFRVSVVDGLVVVEVPD